MGGWLACLAALARPGRVAGMVLVAPAPDFTEALMWPGLSDEARAAIEADGFWMQPSEYGPPYPITRAMIEDGRRWSILPGPVRITAPVRVLQGAQDPDVPWEHALKLAQALEAEDVAFTLIKAGDHRLSTPADLQRLTAVVEELAAMADSPSR
jgi:pimeloyl-ACP methyl ester carboxylesterase